MRPDGLRMRTKGLRMRLDGLRVRPDGLRMRTKGLRMRPDGLRVRHRWPQNETRSSEMWFTHTDGTHRDNHEDVVVLVVLGDGSGGKLYGFVQEGGEVGGAVQVRLAEGVAVDIQDALCGEHMHTCRNLPKISPPRSLAIV